MLMELFLKFFSIKPTEFITINNGIETQLPDEVIGLPLPMPAIETLKLSPYKLNNFRGTTKIVFLSTNLSTQYLPSKKQHNWDFNFV